MPDALAELRNELEAAIGDPELPANTRIAKLRTLRDAILGILGTAETYLADARKRAEAETGSSVRNVLRARAEADQVEARRAVGEAAEGLTHEDLDQLAEEGLLEEALSERFASTE